MSSVAACRRTTSHSCFVQMHKNNSKVYLSEVCRSLLLCCMLHGTQFGTSSGRSFLTVLAAQAHSSQCVESFAKGLIQEYTALKSPSQDDTRQTEQLLLRNHEVGSQQADAAEAAHARENLQQTPVPREEVLAVAHKLAQGMDVSLDSLHPDMRSAVDALAAASATSATALSALHHWEPWWTRGNIQLEHGTHTMDGSADMPCADASLQQLHSAVRQRLAAEAAGNEPPLWEQALLPVPPLQQLLPPGVTPHSSVAYQLVALLVAYAFAVRRVAGQVAQQEELVACDLLQCAPFMHDATLPPVASVRSACDGVLAEAVSAAGVTGATGAKALALASCADAPLLLRSSSSAMRAVAHVHGVLGCVLGLPLDKRGRRRLQAAQRKAVFLLAWLKQVAESGHDGTQRLEDLATASSMVCQSLQQLHAPPLAGAGAAGGAPRN